MFMRMQENFSGCRVVFYSVMSNHFHILREVPPMPEGRISDEELMRRLAAVYSDAFAAEVSEAFDEVRKAGSEALAEEIHHRYSCRMHNLSEFMETLLQRFTRWFNRTYNRSGALWEERYKSVIVEA